MTHEAVSGHSIAWSPRKKTHFLHHLLRKPIHLIENKNLGYIFVVVVNNTQISNIVLFVFLTCNVDTEIIRMVAVGSLSKASIQTRVGRLYCFNLHLMVTQASVLSVNQGNVVLSPGHFLCLLYTFTAQLQFVPRIQSEWHRLDQG